MNKHTKDSRFRFTVLSLILGLIGLSGCAMLVPPTTRSGAVHDVKIEEGLAPSILAVGIGDEIRWVNHRTLPIQIDFLGGALDEVSCQRGFTNWLGLKKESATVGASNSASVCFAKAGVVVYNVRMDSALPGGKQIVQGEVRVGNPGGTATVY
jgi:plastocyanin